MHGIGVVWENQNTQLSLNIIWVMIIFQDIWNFHVFLEKILVTLLLKKPNPEASIRFCEGWFFSSRLTCIGSWKYLVEFIAFTKDYDCSKKTRYCHWQIREEHPFLYSPTENKYIPYDYKPRTTSTWI